MCLKSERKAQSIFNNFEKGMIIAFKDNIPFAVFNGTIPSI
jgi:hypothetical protein